VVTDLGFGKYTTTTAGSTLNMFVYTMSLMIGTAGLPHVIMRFFTVPTVAAARSSAGWALVFIAIAVHDCSRCRRDGQVQPASAR
jgi:cation/acetate symporter